jgi:hypothetical protein
MVGVHCGVCSPRVGLLWRQLHFRCTFVGWFACRCGLAVLVGRIVGSRLVGCPSLASAAVFRAIIRRWVLLWQCMQSSRDRSSSRSPARAAGRGRGGPLKRPRREESSERREEPSADVRERSTDQTSEEEGDDIVNVGLRDLLEYAGLSRVVWLALALTFHCGSLSENTVRAHAWIVLMNVDLMSVITPPLVKMRVRLLKRRWQHGIEPGPALGCPPPCAMRFVEDEAHLVFQVF